MKLVLASDKSGFPLREALQKHLEQQGYELLLFGSQHADEAVPFYQIAPEAAGAIQRGEAALGILICGTGQGMSQVANKCKGIRAACAESEYAARMARVINDSNLLCMGGWLIAPELGKAMADAFLSTQFVTGVEPWRKAWLENAKQEILAMEQAAFKG